MANRAKSETLYLLKAARHLPFGLEGGRQIYLQEAAAFGGMSRFRRKPQMRLTAGLFQRAQRRNNCENAYTLA